MQTKLLWHFEKHLVDIFWVILCYTFCIHITRAEMSDLAHCSQDSNTQPVEFEHLINSAAYADKTSTVQNVEPFEKMVDFQESSECVNHFKTLFMYKPLQYTVNQRHFRNLFTIIMKDFVLINLTMFRGLIFQKQFMNMMKVVRG